MTIGDDVSEERSEVELVLRVTTADGKEQMVPFACS